MSLTWGGRTDSAATGSVCHGLNTKSPIQRQVQKVLRALLRICGCEGRLIADVIFRWACVHILPLAREKSVL